MSLKIKFITESKAITGKMIWEVAIGMGLVLVVVVIMMLITRQLGISLNALDWLDGIMCKITNGAWCSDDAKVSLSVESLKGGINYICSNGGEEVNSNFVSCEGSGEDMKCSVYFYLPQATVALENWIPGAGDPKYLVYHEAFPPGEDVAWTGAQSVSMAIIAIPFVKSAGGALAGGLKGGFVVGTESTAAVFEGVAATEGVEAAIKSIPNAVTIGFKEGVTSAGLKQGIETAIEEGSVGLTRGVVASEAAKLAVSQLEKFIPCGSNVLCVKSAFTVSSKFVEPKTFSLSETCKDTYIELSKLSDYGSKFYLASPCYARLDITRGKCGCVVGKAEMGDKEMTICSEYSNIPDYQSDCIKITPHAIDTGKENFCYTPPKVFGYVATGLSIGRYACGLTGPAAPICYIATTAGAVYLESRTAWPHGFLEAE